MQTAVYCFVICSHLCRMLQVMRVVRFHRSLQIRSQRIHPARPAPQEALPGSDSAGPGQAFGSAGLGLRALREKTRKGRDNVRQFAQTYVAPALTGAKFTIPLCLMVGRKAKHVLFPTVTHLPERLEDKG